MFVFFNLEIYFNMNLQTDSSLQKSGKLRVRSSGSHCWVCLAGEEAKSCCSGIFATNFNGTRI